MRGMKKGGRGMARKGKGKTAIRTTMNNAMRAMKGRGGKSR